MSSDPAAPGASSAGENPLKTGFTALGQALASGDLTQAQADFSKLQDDFKAARQQTIQGLGSPSGAHHGHHGHHRIGNSQPSQAGTDPSDPSSSAAGSVDPTETAQSILGTIESAIDLLA